MLSLIQLQSTPLDSAAPALSLIHALLFLLMILAIPFIPYILLHRSWADQEQRKESNRSPARRMAWLHWHQHPTPLHH